MSFCWLQHQQRRQSYLIAYGLVSIVSIWFYKLGTPSNSSPKQKNHNAVYLVGKLSNNSHLTSPPFRQDHPHFDFTTLLCKFALLIEKDGGIRPCEVLATCAYKVLRSTYPPQKWIGQISESQRYTRLFEISWFLDVRFEI